MAKYKYVAQVDCKRGNTTTYKTLEFVADESNFSGTFILKDLNKVALRFVRNQNGGEIVGYSSVVVSGFSKRDLVQNNSYSNKSNNSYGKKKSLFSYHVLLIPFVLFGRILSILFSILTSLLR